MAAVEGEEPAGIAVSVQEVLARYGQVAIEKEKLLEINGELGSQVNALAGEVARLTTLLESNGIDPASLPAANRAARRSRGKARPAAGVGSKG